MENKDRVPWAKAWALTAAVGLLAGCVTAGSGKPASKILALSVSAIEGQDHFGYEGEVALIGPAGKVAESGRFRGAVFGHRPLAATWSGLPEPSAVRRNEPLQLVRDLRQNVARAAYARGSGQPGTVTVRVELPPEAARRRIADALRRDLASVRAQALEATAKAASGSETVRLRQLQSRAEQTIGQAQQELDRMLATLEVSTVCYWTADRKTYFPLELREQTTLRYKRGGRDAVEKRVAVTRFLRS
jgi:hypothetical protein